MHEAIAGQITNELTKLIVEHRENIFGPRFLETPQEAINAAKNLAAFRRELFDQLKNQDY